MNQLIDLHYFPCINSIVDLIKFSPYCLDASSHFRRSSFTNRTIVLGSSGLLTLSVPIKGGRGVRCPLKEVAIDYSNDWQTNHFRTLSSCYGKSPYFSYFADELQSLFQRTPPLLLDWNLLCLGWVFNKFGLKIENIITTMDQSKANGPLITPRIYDPRNYTSYENGPFLKYVQVFESKTGFFPNISVLDLLFCEGPTAVELIH